jgi:hypothetical protein
MYIFLVKLTKPMCQQVLELYMRHGTHVSFELKFCVYKLTRCWEFYILDKFLKPLRCIVSRAIYIVVIQHVGNSSHEYLQFIYNIFVEVLMNILIQKEILFTLKMSMQLMRLYNILLYMI